MRRKYVSSNELLFTEEFGKNFIELSDKYCESTDKSTTGNTCHTKLLLFIAAADVCQQNHLFIK